MQFLIQIKCIDEILINAFSPLGRKLKLEIEPGTFLVANSGALLSAVQVMR